MVKRNNYNYSLWTMNMHRESRKNHECNAEVPRISNGTTNEYSREMPTKSKGFMHEYPREIPTDIKGFMDEYIREIPTEIKGFIDEYIREIPTQIKAFMDEYAREMPTEIKGFMQEYTMHEYITEIPTNSKGSMHEYTMYEYTTEIPTKHECFMHEYTREMPTQSKGFMHEYSREIPTTRKGFTNRELPRKSKGRTHGYKTGIPRKNNGANFKQVKIDGREIQDGYNREIARKINGTVVQKVELDGKVITVTVTCESRIVDGWIQKNSGLLLGMDLEWRPNFRGGEENKAALLQLCGNESSCLVVQLLYLDSMPRSLVGILSDSEVKIAGVGIDKDAEKLYKDHGLKCRGLVDLQYLASVNLKRTDCLFWGLKRLASEVLGVSIGKDKRVALSDWSKRVLQPWQIEYACIDASVSFCIAARLMQNGWPRELNLEEFTQACFK